MDAWNDKVTLKLEPHPDDDKEETEILNNLRIIAQVRENEKLSTRYGVSISKPTESFLWAKRMYYGESRDQTLEFINHTVSKAFEKINSALELRETIFEEEVKTRDQLLKRLRNTQRIERFRNAISALKETISRKLRSTYETDATTISKIDTLCEHIEDKLNEIDASIKFLSDRSPSIPSSKPVSNNSRKRETPI